MSYLITYIDGTTSNIEADNFTLLDNFVRFYKVERSSGSNTTYPWVATIQAAQIRSIESYSELDRR